MKAASILDNRRTIPLMFSLLLVATIVGCGGSNKGDRSRFDAGRQALMRAKYGPAIEELQGYLKDQPEGKFASRASFLIAKAYMGMGKYKESRSQFEETIRKFPKSEEAHKSQYKLAMLSMIEGDRDDARKRLTEITAKPAGTLVPEAQAMLRYLGEQDVKKPVDNN